MIDQLMQNYIMQVPMPLPMVRPMPTPTTMPMAQPPYMPLRPKLAEAYVPYQQGLGSTFAPSEALEKGTMFPPLYSPYDSGKGGEESW